jgi:hypothetical protein
MSAPTTKAELVAQGYHYVGGGYCKRPGCRATIVWYKNMFGKSIPFNEDTMTPHYTTCSETAPLFKGAR